MRLDRKNQLKLAVCWASPWKPVERIILGDEDDALAYPQALTFTRLHPNEMYQAARTGMTHVPESELPHRVQQEVA